MIAPTSSVAARVASRITAALVLVGAVLFGITGEASAYRYSEQYPPVIAWQSTCWVGLEIWAQNDSGVITGWARTYESSTNCVLVKARVTVDLGGWITNENTSGSDTGAVGQFGNLVGTDHWASTPSACRQWSMNPFVPGPTVVGSACP